MRHLEKFLYFLFPSLLLRKKEWRGIFNDQERENFLKTVNIFFPIAAVVYVLHYFTVDRGEGLAPSDLWFNYRFGMAGIASFCFFLYRFKVVQRSDLAKIPTALACFVFCYFQTRTIVWYAQVPYIYSFAFVLISVVVLRFGIAGSLVYGWATMAAFYPSLVEAKISESMIFSAIVVTSIFIIYIQARNAYSIQLFIANQQSLDAQKKIIELNMEFTNYLRAFLPKEIHSRILFHLKRQRMSVTQAIDEVLRPKQIFVACLFTDIRGYTSATKTDEQFVKDAVLPNIKECTEAIESLRGIPRKVGDLIFSYFDDKNEMVNVLRATLAAFHVTTINKEMNFSTGKTIRRNLIVTAGPAIVGNVGGPASAVEITAMGSPSNLSARIDEMTKAPQFASLLLKNPDSIIVSSEALRLLYTIHNIEHLTEVNLRDLDLQIRDFADEVKVGLVRSTERNRALIQEALENVAKTPYASFETNEYVGRAS